MRVTAREETVLLRYDTIAGEVVLRLVDGRAVRPGLVGSKELANALPQQFGWVVQGLESGGGGVAK